jgi:outer membrane protein OmpA-like peptidoglycan-associated protein
MMRARTLGTIVVLSMLCGLTRPAAAEERRQLRLGFFLGVHGINDDNAADAESGTATPGKLRSTGLLGVRAELEFLPRFAVEAEVAGLPTSAHDGSGEVVILAFRGQLMYRFLDHLVQPFVAAGYGGYYQISDATGRKSDFDGVVHAGGGLRFQVADDFGFRIDGRVLLPPSLSGSVTADWEALLAVYWDLWAVKKERDTDSDGVVDSVDKCPLQPGLKELDGCPAGDRDNDGVSDLVDKCPDEPGPRELDGCPDRDSDGDGVVDRLDKCPNEPGLKELDGCPDRDRDGDEIVDRLDKCPDQPGPKETGGCPDTDKDGDGVVDRLDKCPDQPGPKENDGCPLPEEVKKFVGKIEGITFGLNSAKIRPTSFVVLDGAIKVLLAYPHLPLTIEGHTSSEGKREKNMKLSQARADAVRAYMVLKGVDIKRLSAIGYGPDKPVADNKTKAGKEANRRIEFKIQAQ